MWRLKKPHAGGFITGASIDGQEFEFEPDLIVGSTSTIDKAWSMTQAAKTGTGGFNMLTAAMKCTDQNIVDAMFLWSNDGLETTANDQVEQLAREVNAAREGKIFTKESREAIATPARQREDIRKLRVQEALGSLWPSPAEAPSTELLPLEAPPLPKKGAEGSVDGARNHYNFWTSGRANRRDKTRSGGEDGARGEAGAAGGCAATGHVADRSGTDRY